MTLTNLKYSVKRLIKVAWSYIRTMPAGAAFATRN